MHCQHNSGSFATKGLKHRDKRNSSTNIPAPTLFMCGSFGPGNGNESSMATNVVLVPVVGVVVIKFAIC